MRVVGEYRPKVPELMRRLAIYESLSYAEQRQLRLCISNALITLDHEYRWRDERIAQLTKQLAAALAAAPQVPHPEGSIE